MRSIKSKGIISDLKFVYSDNDTISVIFQNNNMLVGVVGEFNSNLKELEKITETNIYSRGNSILVKGDAAQNEIIKNAIKEIPDESLLYYRLVIYLMDAGKYKESINVLESALSLNFDNHEVLFDFVPNFESQSALIRVINQYKNKKDYEGY